MDLAEFRRLTEHLDGSREIFSSLDSAGVKIVSVEDLTIETAEEDRHGNVFLPDDQDELDDRDEDGRPLGARQLRCVMLWIGDD